MKFLKALLLFIRMYRDGFYFSDNSHKDDDGTRWGFFRFNHKVSPAMFDIDYSFNGLDHNYFHAHGYDYRIEFDNDKQLAKVTETPTYLKKTEAGAWWPHTEVVSMKK